MEDILYIGKALDIRERVFRIFFTQAAQINSKILALLESVKEDSIGQQCVMIIPNEELIFVKSEIVLDYMIIDNPLLRDFMKAYAVSTEKSCLNVGLEISCCFIRHLSRRFQGTSVLYRGTTSTPEMASGSTTEYHWKSFGIIWNKVSLHRNLISTCCFLKFTTHSIFHPGKASSSTIEIYSLVSFEIGYGRCRRRCFGRER